MSELRANFRDLLDLSSELEAFFAFRESHVINEGKFHDPKETYVRRESPVDANRGAGQLLAYLNQASSLAASSESLKKYHFDAEIESIALGVSNINERLVKVAKFFAWLVETCEDTEVKVLQRLDGSGLLNADTKDWMRDYQHPLGSTTRYEGLVGMIMGDVPWDHPFSVGKADRYGFNGSILTVRATTTKRTESGERVTTTGVVSFLSGNAEIGGETLRYLTVPGYEKASYQKQRAEGKLSPYDWEAPDKSKTHGVAIGLNLMTVTGTSESEDTGSKKELGVSLPPPKNSKASKGLTAMYTQYADGTGEANVGFTIPKVGIPIGFHGLYRPEEEKKDEEE